MMSKGFAIADILGGQARQDAPAGQKMQIVMLPAADIEPNPENSIYEIGDVSMLKADIAERGLRSPLEVLPARAGKYMLLAGHRRWTACRALTAEGVTGFDVLPCVIHTSAGADDDLIALITSNATARELTDGERLRQYIALKQALERKKAAGGLDGRVRDEMSRITGDGTGTLGRLNAIANKCVPAVVEMVEKGEISLGRAYECSKLYKVQQVMYAQLGYASLPDVPDAVLDEAVEWVVECGLAEQLKKFDYVRCDRWNYTDGNFDAQAMEPKELTLDVDGADVLVKIEAVNRYRLSVTQLDPAEPGEVVAETGLMDSDLYDKAKALYINHEALKQFKAEAADKKAAEKQRAADDRKWLTMARRELENFDNWPIVDKNTRLGFTVRGRQMFDGGQLVVAVDEAARYDGQTPGLPYRECVAARFDANGQRVGRDGAVVAPDWKKWWYNPNGALERYIAEDIKRAAMKQEG